MPHRHPEHCESCLTPIYDPYEEYCESCAYQICPHCVREIDGRFYCEPCGREIEATRTALRPIISRLEALFDCENVAVEYDILQVEKRYTGLLVTYADGKQDRMDVVIDPDFPADDGGVTYTTRILN